MTIRRIALATVVALLVAGGAIGAGVALGSSSSAKKQGPNPRLAAAGKITASGVKPYKCKAQACVDFSPDGSIQLGSGVSYVDNPATGVYCIGLPKIAAIAAPPLATPDAFTNGIDSVPAGNYVGEWGDSTVCSGTYSDNNAIELLVYNSSDALAESSMFVSVP